MRQNLILSAHSELIEWYTPPEIFEGLGCNFDLDPASPLSGPVTPAARHFTVEDDGLEQPWDGFVWLNPPYYRSVVPYWVRKMKEHNNGIMLVFARTDTGWFQNNAPDSIFFIGGRLKFINGYTGKPGDNTGGAPSMLCGYGPVASDVLASCKLKGVYYGSK